MGLDLKLVAGGQKTVFVDADLLRGKRDVDRVHAQGVLVLHGQASFVLERIENLAILAHPRPAALGVDMGIGLERHALPSELDDDASDVPCIL